MKATDYKAVRATGASKFAVYPLAVHHDVPNSIKQANKAESVRSCPTGMLEMRVLDDDVTWEEDFTLGCGDQTYQRQRRNGVLVQAPLDSYLAWKNERRSNGNSPLTEADVAKWRNVEVVEVTGKKTTDKTKMVHVIVAKAMILAPWGEYALIEAEREKMKSAEKERRDRLHAAQEAVGGQSSTYYHLHVPSNKRTVEYRTARARVDYDVEFEWGGHKRSEPYEGQVTITMRRAEEIRDGIAALERGDAKAALRLLKP